MRRAAGVVAMSFLGAMIPLAAQDSTQLATGDAVKVTAPSMHFDRWPGVFEQWRGDSVAVRGAGKDSTLAVIPIGVIKQFEVNHGNRKSHGHFWAGAIVGLVIGVGIGAADASSCESTTYDICVDPGVEAGTLGLIGGLLGGGIGALIRTDPYKVVQLHPAPHVSVLPGGGVGIGVSLRL
jgi:hypothetical protein